MPNAGGLEKMVLTSFTDDAFTAQAQTMTVSVNPESYSHRYKILYNKSQAQGAGGNSPRFNKTAPDEVDFQLIFDGTGVVPASVPGDAPVDVTAQVKSFLRLAFDYDGDIHSPNFVQIAWGTLVFNGRLTSLNVVYSLFKPDGKPLRARADAAFIGFMNQKEIAKREERRSPDLSRVVTVQGGDTLPLLCYRVYGSSLHYAQVAKRNGMVGFRDLVPGEQIVFPPLGEASL